MNILLNFELEKTKVNVLLTTQIKIFPAVFGNCLQLPSACCCHTKISLHKKKNKKKYPNLVKEYTSSDSSPYSIIR